VTQRSLATPQVPRGGAAVRHQARPGPRRQHARPKLFLGKTAGCPTV